MFALLKAWEMGEPAEARTLPPPADQEPSESEMEQIGAIGAKSGCELLSAEG